MADSSQGPSPREEILQTPLQQFTPNTKVSAGKSKSRLRGRVNCRVLFPPEEPPQQILPTVQRSKATPIKWSDAERRALQPMLMESVWHTKTWNFGIEQLSILRMCVIPIIVVQVTKNKLRDVFFMLILISIIVQNNGYSQKCKIATSAYIPKLTKLGVSAFAKWC